MAMTWKASATYTTSALPRVQPQLGSSEMARRGAGLANLVHVGEKGENGLPFAALIDERFRAAEGCACLVQEVEDNVGGFGDVNLAVGLFFGPAGAGYEE